MRLFFALDLPWALKESLTAFRAKQSGFHAAWSDPQKLHLTLAFLGEVPEERLDSLRRLGGAVAKRHAEMQLRTSSLGGFPRSREARVLWLGLEANPALEALVADLHRALIADGTPLDRKPFAAHLTLARLRVPGDITPLSPAPEPQDFVASELVLYRSHLLAKGSRYERVDAFAFGG